MTRFVNEGVIAAGQKSKTEKTDNADETTAKEASEARGQEAIALSSAVGVKDDAHEEVLVERVP